MAIDISCSNCGRDFRVKDDAAGKSFTCKACGTKIRIPKEDDDVIDVEYVDDDESALTPFENDDNEEEFVRRPQRKKKKSANAGDKTLGPAIGLYVTAGLAMLLFLSLTVIRIGSGAPMAPDPVGINQAQREAHRIGYQIGYYGAPAVEIIFMSIILFGAYCLQTHGSYGMAMTACILATIPCCSPLFILGMPFGIWGIIVLNDEGVKRAFG